MELGEFKNIVDDCLQSKGMTKRKNRYYFETEDLTTVLGLQRSNHSIGYYFNLGFVIKELNDKQYPDYSDGNVRLRFDFQIGGTKTDIIDIKEMSKDLLVTELEKNVTKYVLSITGVQTLEMLFKENPILLYQATLKTKQYFGIE